MEKNTSNEDKDEEITKIENAGGDKKDEKEESPKDDEKGEENDEEDESEEDGYDVSYDDFDSSIILFVDGGNLLENGGSSTLSMYIPKGNEPESVDIYNNRILLQTVDVSDLEQGADVLLHGLEYSVYTYELDTEDMADDSNYIFVTTEDHGSNTAEIFQPLVMTEEDVQLTYDTLCDISDISNEILNSGEEFTTDDFMNAVVEYLHNSDSIIDFWVQGTTVYFTMTNGETSFFTASEADGTFSSGGTNINGAYSEDPEKAEGECDPYTYFDPVQNRNENITTVNPNVLIMAPIRQSENAKAPIFNLGAANGDAEESLGKKIANNISGGSYDLKVNGECDADLVRRWDDYGTILLNTHGPNNDGLFSYDGRESDSIFFSMGAMYGFSPVNHGMDEFKALARNWECTTNDLEENHYYWKKSGVYKGIYLTHLNLVGVIECSVAVTSDYMMYLLEDAEFENTVFVFDVCNGLSDDKFNSFLLSKGASCVWGYTESINGEVSQSLISDLYDYFFAVEAETEYSKYTTLISEGQRKDALLDDITLECRRPEDGVFYTYKGHTELNGTVTDEICGEPVKNVAVKVYRYYDGEKKLYKEVKTGDDGTYSVSDIPYGIYMIEGVYGENHVFINFSIGNATKKTIDFEVREYIPIYTYDELLAISGNTYGKYFLMNDITLSSDFTSVCERFEGVFIGDGHTIFNVNYPLFESVNNGRITGLGLVMAAADPLPMIEKHGNYGALAAAIHSSTISNCTVSGSISASLPDKEGGNVGGFAGHIENTTMENCSSSVSVTLQVSNISIRGGGFAGYIKNTTIKDSHNTGSISLTSVSNDTSLFSATHIRAGGFAGEGSVTLENCYNTGAVSAKGGNFEGSKAGGFVGDGKVTATSTWNSGTVTAYMPTENNLGLIESIMSGNATAGTKEEADSFRTGINNVNFMFWYDPPQGGYAGGFVGAGHCILTDCYNSGDVIGSYCAGGIIGKSWELRATNTVNFGSVTGTYCTGGFVGYLAREYWAENASLKSCYVLGTVGSAYICAPFAGIVDNELLETVNCCYTASTGIDSSLEIVQVDSKNHVFTMGADISSILSDSSFDFENIWSYDAESGSLVLKNNLNE